MAFNFLIIIILVLFIQRGNVRNKVLVNKLTYEDNLFIKVQGWRRLSGRKEYVLNSHLCGRAEERTIEIKTDWSHDGFYKLTSQDKTFLFNGENLSEGYEFPEEVLEGWLNSPVHRDILERDYTDACIRCTSDFFCAAEFGK